MHDTHPIEADLQARWLPSDEARRQARVLLDAVPDADYVVVPMVQPGKAHGIWTLGQEVQTVPGVLILAVNTFFDGSDAHDILTLDWARARAADVATQWLLDTDTTGRGGTVAYATIDRAGRAAVWEV